MKIAFVGYRTPIWETTYSENINLYYFAYECSLLCQTTHIFGGDKRIDINQNMARLPYSDLNPKNYDLIYTMSIHGINTLKKMGFRDWSKVYAKHFTIQHHKKQNPAWYEMESFCINNCKFFDVTTPEALFMAKKIYGNIKNLVNIPNACPYEIPLPNNNPYTNRKKDLPVALYLGSLGSDYQWSKLAELSSYLKNKVNFYIVSFHIPSKADKIIKNSSTLFKLPAVDNNLIWNYFFHADVGIGLNGDSYTKWDKNNITSKTCRNDIAKIYYYKRAGLPVVVPDNVSNHNLLTKKHDYIVPTNSGSFSMNQYAQAVIRIANQGKRDIGAITYFKFKQSYRNRVKEFMEIING